LHQATFVEDRNTSQDEHRLMAATDRLLTLVVPVELDGERLDRVVARLLAEHTRAYLRELIDAGLVRVDGELRKPAEAVAAGATIEVALRQRRLLRPGGDAPLPALTVLFEDESILVIDKPAGMATHPSGGIRWGTAAQAAEAHVGRALPAPARSADEEPATAGEDERPGIVHRLDKDTSGCLVIAKTEAALADLQRQFQERRVGKEYEAIVFGVPRFLSEVIERGIVRDPRHPDRMMARREGGREAITYYEVRRAFDGLAWLLCRPRTGRTHQIRVHLSAIGHPLVGDAVYRPRGAQHLVLPKGAPDPGRQCLHASTLELRHPASGELLRFAAPMPSDMQGLLDWLARERPDRGREAR
jgi:23S rRNA pseudouridine1911/1915/1917 synthase